MIQTTSTSTVLGNTIRTKYLKATATRGPRIKATLVATDFPSVTKSWQYDADAAGNHAFVARVLADLYSEKYLVKYGEKHRITRLTGFRISPSEYAFGLVHGDQ
jgi:hypothetical protein